MSKKKTAVKRRAKVNGAAGRARAVRKPARRSARSQSLPGFEQVRNQRLDNICEAIGDERETMNEAKREVSGLINSALKTMHDSNVSIYRHGRIELALVPGAERLRVRLVKEHGDAEVQTGVKSEKQVDLAALDSTPDEV